MSRLQYSLFVAENAPRNDHSIAPFLLFAVKYTTFSSVTTCHFAHTLTCFPQYSDGLLKVTKAIVSFKFAMFWGIHSVF